MFFIKLSSVFALLAATSSFAQVPPLPDCAFYHIANAGESCASIAYHVGTTVAKISDCNVAAKIGCDTSIVPGTKVYYPSTGLSKPNWSCGGGGYTVKPGDSCESIATALKIEVASIYFCNAINAGCTNIYAGQTLSVIPS